MESSSGSLKLPSLPVPLNGKFAIINGVSIDTSKPRSKKVFDGPTKRVCAICGHLRSFKTNDFPYKHKMHGCQVEKSDYVDIEKRYQGWCECQACQQGSWEINYPKPETLLSTRK